MQAASPPSKFVSQVPAKVGDKEAPMRDGTADQDGFPHGLKESPENRILQNRVVMLHYSVAKASKTVSILIKTWSSLCHESSVTALHLMVLGIFVNTR